MRKTSVLLLFVVFMMVSVACNTTSEKGSSGSQTTIQDKIEASSGSEKSIEGKITINKLPRRTTIQDYELQTQKDVIFKTEDSSITTKFTDAIKDSEKITGIANVASPRYEVTIQNDGNEISYYLWININDKTKKSNAMYMNKGDTDTGYKISVEKTNSLIKLFNEIDKE